MNKSIKNWMWFGGIMGLIVGLGFFVGQNRRHDPGERLVYSIDEYRSVDPALIRYNEVDPLIPTFSNLTALAISSNNTVFVAGSNRVEQLSTKETFSIEGTPTCLAVDEQSQLYVGLRDHLEIINVADGGRQIIELPGTNALATSVAVDGWYIYVADAGQRRVWRYERGTEKPPLEIGKKNYFDGVRGFVIPSPYFDLAIAPNASIWVVNPGRHAFENYRPDGMPLSHWEQAKMGIEGFCGCCNPSHFALLSDGSFVTAEKGLVRVKIYAPDGGFVCVVAAPDQFKDGVVGLDLAVDRADRIYVLDPAENKIRIFEEKE